MTRKDFVKNLLIASFVSGVVFLFSVFKLDPRSGVVSIVIFMLSLFLFLASVFASVSFLLINKLRNNETSQLTRVNSLRRGALLGIYVVIALSLSALELLTWWDALLLAFSLVLFELYFMSGKERIS